MRLTLRTLTNKSFHLDVEGKDTVLQLKTVMQEEHGLGDVAEQRVRLSCSDKVFLYAYGSFLTCVRFAL
jgi:hypothetical protein